MSLSRLPLWIPNQSSDGIYHGRYPRGNAPTLASGRSDAVASSVATGSFAAPSGTTASLLAYLKASHSKPLLGSILEIYASNPTSLITNIHSATGKTPAIIQLAYNLGGSVLSSTSSPYYSRTLANGTYGPAGNILWLSWWWGNPNISANNFGGPGGTWAQIFQVGSPANVNMNTMIDAFCADVKLYNYPVVLRFGLEMEGDWFWWGAHLSSSSTGLSDASPANYIQWFRYVVNRIRSNGVTNVLFHWCANGEATGVNYFPGTDVVDIGGWDGYPPSTITDPSNQYSSVPLYNLLTGYGIPIYLGEVGVAPETTTTNFGNSASLEAAYQTLFPAIKGYIWWCQSNDLTNQLGLSQLVTQTLTLSDLPAEI